MKARGVCDGVQRHLHLTKSPVEPLRRSQLKVTRRRSALHIEVEAFRLGGDTKNRRSMSALKPEERLLFWIFKMWRE